jgi:hypothetical protein
MVKTLSQYRGVKFFNRLVNYLEENKSYRNNKLLNQLKGAEITENEDLPLKPKNIKTDIKGGTILVNGKLMGFLLAFNDFANLKRNNFTNVGTIIIDEFVPEKIDIRSLDIPYKIVSLIQSIGRLSEQIDIYMLGNLVRFNDPILVKLGISSMKAGEFKKIFIDNKLFGIIHRVNPKDYPQFKKKSDKSVAGKIAKILGETDLDNNTIKNILEDDITIPKIRQSSKYDATFYGNLGSVRMHSVKNSSEKYMVFNYGSNNCNNICLDKKFITPNIKYFDFYKKYLLNLYQNKLILFDNTNT